MKLKDILFAIIAVIALVSCNNESVSNGFVKSNLVFDNQSQYSITIDKSENCFDVKVEELPQSITLLAGESMVIEDVPSLSVCKAWGYVVYGGVVALDFCSETPYSTYPAQYSIYDITRAANYKMSSINNSRSEFRYTFTDADYQFALENGTVVK